MAWDMAILPGYGARYEGGGGDKKQIPPDRDDTRLLLHRDNAKWGDSLIVSTKTS